MDNKSSMIESFGNIKASDEDHCRMRFTMLLGSLSNVISSEDFGLNTQKALFYIKMMIGIVPNDDNRLFIKNKLDRLIKDAGLDDKEKIKNMKDEEIKNLRVNTILDIIGDITDAISNYYNINNVIIKQSDVVSLKKGD